MPAASLRLLVACFAALAVPMALWPTAARAQVPLVFRGAVLSALVLLVLTTAVTKIFYTYWLRPEYEGGLPAFYLMLPGYFCWSIVIYFGAYFSWRGLFYNNLLISASCFILMLCCDLLLIPGYSFKGAALANSLAYSATLVVCVALFFRETGIGFLKIFQLQKGDFSTLTKLLK